MNIIAKDIWYEHNEPPELIPIKPPEIELIFKNVKNGNMVYFIMAWIPLPDLITGR